MAVPADINAVANPVATVAVKQQPSRLESYASDSEGSSFMATLQGKGFDIIHHHGLPGQQPRRRQLQLREETLCCADAIGGSSKASVSLLEAVQGDIVKGWQTDVFTRSSQVSGSSRTRVHGWW